MSTIRSRYKCPISMEVMRDPVMCPSGHNFERASILNWLRSNKTCPMGRHSLSVDDLAPNLSLKEEIAEAIGGGGQSASFSGSIPQGSPIPRPSAGPPRGHTGNATPPTFEFRPDASPSSARRPEPHRPSAPRPSAAAAWGELNNVPQWPMNEGPNGPSRVSYGAVGSAQRGRMTQEEQDRVFALFLTFDADDSGELDKGELTRLCRVMNYPHRPVDIDRMFAAMDTDGSGALDFSEFMAYMKDHRPDPGQAYGLSPVRYEEFMMQFHSFDTDRSGELDRREFARLCRALGYTHSAADADALFTVIDTDRSNSIDAHEFLTFMKQHGISEYNPFIPANFRRQPPAPSPPQQQQQYHHPPGQYGVAQVGQAWPPPRNSPRRGPTRPPCGACGNRGYVRLEANGQRKPCPFCAA